jgi:hypothetical protein
MKQKKKWSSTNQIRHLQMLRSLGKKPTNSRRGLASVHLAPDVAVSIMHSNRFKLQVKGLLCVCNPYACVASARVPHRTCVLPARLRLPNQAPAIQVLRFTNVVWLHYFSTLVHNIFGVSVNVINNIMAQDTGWWAEKWAVQSV